MLRIRTQAQFQLVMSQRPVASTPHFALHRLFPGPHAAFVCAATPRPEWLGAVVPKRWASRAVTRNTIKRQIYQLAGGVQAPAQLASPTALVVRLRSGFSKQLFKSATSHALKEAVRGELLQLLALAGRST